MNKINIDLFSEFCYEVFSAAPYAYWLKEQGKLGKITTCKGMKPYYYFCDDVEEKYEKRSLDNLNNGVQNLPNNWIHHNPDVSEGNGLDHHMKNTTKTMRYYLMMNMSWFIINLVRMRCENH